MTGPDPNRANNCAWTFDALALVGRAPSPRQPALSTARRLQTRERKAQRQFLFGRVRETLLLICRGADGGDSLVSYARETDLQAKLPHPGGKAQFDLNKEGLYCDVSQPFD